MAGPCRLYVSTYSFLLAITIESSCGLQTCSNNNINSSRCCIGHREIEGMCTECIGFYGEECSLPCPAGFYGRQCKMLCNCSSIETCNQFVGCRSNSTCEMTRIPRRTVRA
uniref:Uncharacterized protein n=1 Tax=Magallana gigas TaxID=29159 RepID=A0A8W8KC53_MAGGI